MMNMNEESMKLRTISMDNRDYQLGNMSHFDMPLRIENLFTAKELSSTSHTNEMAVTISTLAVRNEAGVPTFEINDSDDSDEVVFVAEYNNDIVQNEIPLLEPFPLDYVSLESDTTSSSTSSDGSPKGKKSNGPPRRNPTRKGRSSKYKKKCSEYITEEDFNILIASDEESTGVETAKESLPNAKETRPKKVVVNNWPTEGLHERPVYNEQTEEIEKFDYSIIQIQNSVEKVKTEKPKKLKAPKKKYTPKKYTYKNKKNKNNVKKKEVEMACFEELGGLINGTYKLLSQNFMKIVIASRRAGLHMCPVSETNEDKENHLEDHKQCLANYDELMRNQSMFYCLSDEEVNFDDLYNKLKSEFENQLT